MLRSLARGGGRASARVGGGRSCAIGRRRRRQGVTCYACRGAADQASGVEMPKQSNAGRPAASNAAAGGRPGRSNEAGVCVDLEGESDARLRGGTIRKAVRPAKPAGWPAGRRGSSGRVQSGRVAVPMPRPCRPKDGPARKAKRLAEGDGVFRAVPAGAATDAPYPTARPRPGVRREGGITGLCRGRGAVRKGNVRARRERTHNAGIMRCCPSRDMRLQRPPVERVRAVPGWPSRRGGARHPPLTGAWGMNQDGPERESATSRGAPASACPGLSSWGCRAGGNEPAGALPPRGGSLGRFRPVPPAGV
jgi:hypothetical protein